MCPSRFDIRNRPEPFLRTSLNGGPCGVVVNLRVMDRPDKDHPPVANLRSQIESVVGFWSTPASLRGEIPNVTTKSKSARRPQWYLGSHSMTAKNIVLFGSLACLEMVCRADSPTLNSTSYPYVGVTLSHYSAASPQQN